MASFKLKSIVFLSALVGCTLISTVAGDGSETEIEKLTNNIKRGSYKEVEEKLKNYERQDDKIDEYSVGQLVELCRESLDKCFYPKLIDIISVANDYMSFLEIKQYGYYCREKMDKFCLDNIDEVTENLLNSVTEEEKEIAKPFWESLRSSGLIERAHQNAIALGVDYHDFEIIEIARRAPVEERENIRAQVREAYSAYKKTKCGTSAGDLELFFFKFLSSMKRYFNIYRLYYQIRKKDQSAPKLKDETAIDVFKFARIADMFYVDLSRPYFAELAKKMGREYGCEYNLFFYEFETQTEEEFRKRREILKGKNTWDRKAKSFFRNKKCFEERQQ